MYCLLHSPNRYQQLHSLALRSPLPPLQQQLLLLLLPRRQFGHGNYSLTPFDLQIANNSLLVQAHGLSELSVLHGLSNSKGSNQTGHSMSGCKHLTTGEVLWMLRTNARTNSKYLK